MSLLSVKKFEPTISWILLQQGKANYTGAPIDGTPVLGTHYIVTYDAEVCGAERQLSGIVQGRIP